MALQVSIPDLYTRTISDCDRYREDNAGEGSREQHQSILHPRCGVRVRAEISRRSEWIDRSTRSLLIIKGPRMVRDVFRLARENSPCIIFIDEVDAIATKRFDAQTGSDREVQRILLELLNQMDGFDQQTTVKVIMATNRQDTLDPALLRPGRLDRKIEFPMPSRRERRLIFQTVTAPMNLGPDVDLEDCKWQACGKRNKKLIDRCVAARPTQLCGDRIHLSGSWTSGWVSCLIDAWLRLMG